MLKLLLQYFSIRISYVAKSYEFNDGSEIFVRNRESKPFDLNRFESPPHHNSNLTVFHTKIHSIPEKSARS